MSVDPPAVMMTEPRPRLLPGGAAGEERPGRARRPSGTRRGRRIRAEAEAEATPTDHIWGSGRRRRRSLARLHRPLWGRRAAEGLAGLPPPLGSSSVEPGMRPWTQRGWRGGGRRSRGGPRRAATPRATPSASWRRSLWGFHCCGLLAESVPRCALAHARRSLGEANVYCAAGGVCARVCVRTSRPSVSATLAAVMASRAPAARDCKVRVLRL